VPPAPALPTQVAWGAAEIGRFIDRTPRQVAHLLKIKAITCAQKKGHVWAAPVSALLAEFGIAR
jgi:hypothetical protein